MDILVTALALARSLERNLSRVPLRIGRPVAIQASQCQVRAGKREVRPGVVERFQPLPGGQAVAGLANVPGGLAAGACRCRKLSLVRIPVTAHARQVAKMELPVAGAAVFFPVTILTRHGGMRALQGEAGRLMIFQAEGGRLKAVHRVAAVAAVGRGSAGELPGMRILVAVQAGREPRVIVGSGAGWRVALGAGQSLVFAGDRVGGGLVAGLGERRGAPAR